MKNFFMALLGGLLAPFVCAAARPIARWDVVPYQRLQSPFRAGVVAFHEKGVTVEFSIEGRPVLTTSQRERNPRTGVNEFVLPIDPRAYPDGPITVRATVRATGDAASAYTLPDLVLYADSGCSLGSQTCVWVDAQKGNEFASGLRDEPVKTLSTALMKAGDGGTVYLLAGTHSAKRIGAGKDRKYWSTITLAPGVPRKAVKVIGGRLGSDKLRFKGLNLYTDLPDHGAVARGEGGGTSAWFDDCRMTAEKGRYAGRSMPFGSKLHAYVTGGETYNMSCGPTAELLRDHTIRCVSDDALPPSDCLVVNVKVEDIDAGDTMDTPDFFRAFVLAPNWAHDVILYHVRGLNCKSRAFTGSRFRDSALVDIEVETTGGELMQSQFNQEAENLIFANVTVTEQAWQWMQPKNGRGNFVPTDVRLFAVKCAGFSGFDEIDGSRGLTILPEYDIIQFPKGEK